MDNDDLGRIVLETGTKPDKNARKEENFFDQQRREGLKKAIHWAVICAVCLASFCLLLLFVIRMWHLGMPDKWLWLDSSRLQKIDAILFSGFVGAFVSRYLQTALPSR